MTRRSPVTTYPSPLEMRRARQKPGVSGGALLALLLMIGVYGLIGWLVVKPHRQHQTAAVHASGADRGALVEPRHSEAGLAPTVIEALRRHPCNGCDL